MTWLDAVEWGVLVGSLILATWDFGRDWNRHRDFMRRWNALDDEMR